MFYTLCRSNFIAISNGKTKCVTLCCIEACVQCIIQWKNVKEQVNSLRTYKEQVVSANTTLKQLREKLEKTKSKKDKLKRELNEALSSNNKLQSNLNQLENEIDHNQQIADLKSQLEESNYKIEQLNLKIQELQTQNSRQKEEIDRIQISSTLNVKSKRNRGSNLIFDDLMEEEDENESKIRSLQKEIKNLKEHISQLEQRNDETKENYEDQNRKLKSENQKMKSKIDSLERELESKRRDSAQVETNHQLELEGLKRKLELALIEQEDAVNEKHAQSKKLNSFLDKKNKESEQMAMQISEQTSLVLKLKQKISKLQNENEEMNQKNEIEVNRLENENKQLTSNLAKTQKELQKLQDEFSLRLKYVKVKNQNERLLSPQRQSGTLSPSQANSPSNGEMVSKIIALQNENERLKEQLRMNSASAGTINPETEALKVKVKSLEN